MKSCADVSICRLQFLFLYWQGEFFIYATLKGQLVDTLSMNLRGFVLL